MPVYLVDKPLGLSSHAVVSRARKQLNTRSVGHAGTLDPLATGVLLILSHDATKLSPFLTGADKHYLAWVSFGASTPSLDAEGPVIETKDASQLSEAMISAALPAFLELREQLPPKYSAIKQAGVKGYEAARKGRELEFPPRPVVYDRIDCLAFAGERSLLPQHFAYAPNERSWGPEVGGRRFQLPEPLAPLPTALIRLSVGAGTYIRAFARDLGAALGVPAHLSGLVRTASGNHGLEQAVSVETLAGAKGLGKAEVLPYPLIALTETEAARVRQGQRLSPGFEGRAGLVDAQGRLVAVAENVAGRMRLLRVWNPGP